MLASVRIQRVLLGLLVVLVAAIAVVLVTGRVGTLRSPAPSRRTAYQGNLLPNHLRAANFTLTDQDGRRVTFDRDRGHVVVLTFIYTHCHNACPFMVEQIKGALGSLPHDGRGVRVIGVSVEPRRDTPAARRRFLAKHEMTGRMQFLDGPMKLMRHIWHEYAIQPQSRTAPHSAFVLVIDKRGYEKIGFPAVQLTPGALAYDIRKLERQRA